MILLDFKLNARLFRKTKNDARDDQVRTHFVRASLRILRRNPRCERFPDVAANSLYYTRDDRRAQRRDDFQSHR